MFVSKVLTLIWCCSWSKLNRLIEERAHASFSPTPPSSWRKWNFLLPETMNGVGWIIMVWGPQIVFATAKLKPEHLCEPRPTQTLLYPNDGEVRDIIIIYIHWSAGRLIMCKTPFDSNPWSYGWYYGRSWIMASWKLEEKTTACFEFNSSSIKRTVWSSDHHSDLDVYVYILLIVYLSIYQWKMHIYIHTYISSSHEVDEAWIWPFLFFMNTRLNWP